MAYDDTRDIYDPAQATVSQLVAESIRLAITLANIVADEVVRARQRRYELERQASEERLRLDIERLRAERAAAEPLLRAAHQERFWRELDPSREEHLRRLGRTWQAASEWAGGDPYAAYTLDVLREQLRERFGIETPTWQVGGAELARIVSLANPEFRAQLDQARAAATEAGSVSYSVIIRDRDDPYSTAYQGEVTVPAAVTAEEAAARVYTEWAASEGAATVQGQSERFDVELRENTGSADAVAVPAVMLSGGQAADVLAAAESRRRALVAGTETGSDAESLYALSEEIDRLEAEEAQRQSRRADYAARLEDPELDEGVRERLQRNINAIDEGLPRLHQEQAEAALKAAATAAEMRGENGAHVYDRARLAESLDEGWWETASPAEIAGVWDHVGAWQEGQARSEMQSILREGIERHHRLIVPQEATSDMVAALYGGRDMPGPAVPLSAHGEALREQAHALYEAAFDDQGQAAVKRAEAEQAEGEAEAAALRTTAEHLAERAAQSTAQATLLMEQGTWLDMQTPEVLGALYRDNSAAAVDELAARFEEQWGRPLIPQATEQLAETAAQMAAANQPWVIPAGVGSVNPASTTTAGVMSVARTVTEEVVSTVETLTEQGTESDDWSDVYTWDEDGDSSTGQGADAERTRERQEAAAAALDALEDTEAAEAAGLARLAFPEGPEGAVATPPQSGRSSGGAGPAADRQRAEEAQL